MFKALLMKLIGREVRSIDLELKFYKEANVHGEHGQIRVTHRRHGLIEKSVPFVFVGITTPPLMDLRLMTYIWEEAAAQGYIPHTLLSYGKENETVFTVRPLMADTILSITGNGLSREQRVTVPAKHAATEPA